MDIAASTAGRLAAFAAIVVAALAAPGAARAVTFTVNAASDEADAALNGSCDADSGTSGEQCTLRAAIQEANNLGGPDAIHFSIGITAPVKITPASKLPAVTSPLTIDGSTQPGAFTTIPGIELDASNEAGGDGLEFASGSGGSVVRGIVINHSPGWGLRLAAQTSVMRTWIGTDTSGLVAAGNASGGILVTTGGAGSRIGVSDQLRNVISANGGPGVQVAAGPVSIENNYIGTNYVGWSPLGNSGAGIAVSDGASGDTIGGTDTSTGNLVSGNQGPGIAFDGSTAPVVAGNVIGLNASGEFAMGNAGNGITLHDAPNAVIGVQGTTGRNVISGNAGHGVAVETGSGNAAINGNYIGLRVDGTGVSPANPAGIGNSADGISVESPDVSIGETTANVISGQDGTGIRIRAGGATVANNLIGYDVFRLVLLGNGGDGISFENVTSGRIGSANHGNLIFASGRSGIRLAGTSNLIVQGNGVGIDQNGFGGGNGTTGNYAAVAMVDGTTGTVLGGIAPGEGNVIAAEQGTGDGVTLAGTAPGTNTIRGNGISVNGGLGIDLGDDGITPNDASDADSGWNSLQNFPLITDAVRSPDTVRLSGVLDTTPGVADYALDFFLSTACDESGNGEGSKYIASRTVQTNAAGHAAFSFDLPATSSAQTNLVTATATSPSGATSEFSPCSESPYTGTLEIQPPNMPVREPGGQVVLLIQRLYGTAGTISVDYSTSDGTATAPADYTATSSTVVFEPGETAKEISIPINDDRFYEGDETFTVTLSKPGLTAIPGPISSVVTIIDNDPFRPDQVVADVKISGSSNPVAKKAVKRCKVPKLKGLTKKKAKAKLKKAKCKLGKVRKTKKKVKSKKLRNRVVTQKPRAGKKVKVGTKVTLTLGRR